MRTFLGSNLFKKGVSWRGFKASIIFALGFYTNNALTPNVKTMIKEAEESHAEAKSLAKESLAHLAKLKESRKTMLHLKQLYDVRMAKFEQDKKANGRYAMDTCSESQAESVWSCRK